MATKTSDSRTDTGTEAGGGHVTDKASDKLSALAAPLANTDGPGKLGISPNPATNMMIADIAMRGVEQIVRKTMHKSVLQNAYGPDKAKKIVENKSIFRSLALYGASRIATRSVPGAALVGGGLLVKALLERSQARRGDRRKVKAKGERTLEKMAE